MWLLGVKTCYVGYDSTSRIIKITPTYASGNTQKVSLIRISSLNNSSIIISATDGRAPKLLTYSGTSLVPYTDSSHNIYIKQGPYEPFEISCDGISNITYEISSVDEYSLTSMPFNDLSSLASALGVGSTIKNNGNEDQNINANNITTCGIWYISNPSASINNLPKDSADACNLISIGDSYHFVQFSFYKADNSYGFYARMKCDSAITSWISLHI